MTRNLTACCACGAVEMVATGEPIVAATCHCRDCTEGSRRIEALPGAAPILDDLGGTPYLLVRRDRLRITQGADRLTEMRLKPDSKSRRVVATCCNSAMYLDVAPAHWLTTYRDRWDDSAPLVSLRLATGGTDLGDDPLPHGVRATAGLAARLVAAWVPMLLARPKRLADGTAV